MVPVLTLFAPHAVFLSICSGEAVSSCLYPEVLPHSLAHGPLLDCLPGPLASLRSVLSRKTPWTYRGKLLGSLIFTLGLILVYRQPVCSG